MHVSAQFADAHRTINGSLFFSHDNIPTTLAVQDICQLVAVEMQEWNGCVQLKCYTQGVMKVPRAPRVTASTSALTVGRVWVWRVLSCQHEGGGSRSVLRVLPLHGHPVIAECSCGCVAM